MAFHPPALTLHTKTGNEAELLLFRSPSLAKGEGTNKDGYTALFPDLACVVKDDVRRAELLGGAFRYSTEVM